MNRSHQLLDTPLSILCSQTSFGSSRTLFLCIVITLVFLRTTSLPAEEISTSTATAQNEAPAEIKFVRTWGKQGDQPGEFHFPIDIAINNQDELFVTDHLNHRLQKFDTQGKLLGQFPVLPNPSGIDIDSEENIYLTHFPATGTSEFKTDHEASIYSADGRLVRKWGRQGSADGEFDCPGGLTVAKDGRIYIADQTNRRVQVFDKTGKFLFKWGEYGNEPGQFGGKTSPKSRTGGPQFLTFDREGNIWTTEGANCRIQKFTADGKNLLQWGTDKDEPGGFGGYFTGFKNLTPKSLLGPIALQFDRKGNLWISAVSGRVQQFTLDGKYLNGLGEEQGSETGQFYAPHGIVFDSLGYLYVVDSYNHRIQKFEIKH